MTRLAVVTGGSRGIGAAIAQRLQADGCKVVVVDISAEQLDAFGTETRIKGYRLDVSRFAEVEQVFAQIERDNGPIDILVNNAGITRDGVIHKMDPQTQWQAVIDVNLTSVFNTVRCTVPGMRERGWGRIVNMSSMNGLKGQFGQANYAAAKAGMIGFTKSIAQEMAAKGVTANCVAPGFILTDMTRAMPAEILNREQGKIPAGRMGTPEDIAAAVAFLASEQAGFITGQVISSNGGQYM
ncbi:MAG TPA: beta-ketoacyl-ACP reductase [Azospirillaceae bacterium]|nr:beta-ketoacyl-ACP reductase [Azospirillaceae bacterium]